MGYVAIRARLNVDNVLSSGTTSEARGGVVCATEVVAVESVYEDAARVARTGNESVRFIIPVGPSTVTFEVKAQDLLRAIKACQQ
jgi:hypothetical protein